MENFQSIKANVSYETQIKKKTSSALSKYRGGFLTQIDFSTNYFNLKEVFPAT